MYFKALPSALQVLYFYGVSLHFAMNLTAPEKLYTKQFLALCTASLLFFASFNLFLGELPSYLQSLGGGDYKGFIIALFTVTAMITRPLSGKLADTIGRKPVILLGLLVGLGCFLLYPVLSFMSGFLFLRLLNGFSVGFTPTAVSTYIADIVPPARVGEAMGILGLISNIGTTIAPLLGGEIMRLAGLDWVFYSSAMLTVLSILMVFSLPETLPAHQKFEWQMLRLHKADLSERRVFAPVFVMFFTVFSYGAMLTTMPDFCAHVGLSNKGYFFGITAGSSLLARFLAGKASDVYGRQVVMAVGVSLLIVAFIYLAYAQTWVDITIGAVIYGISAGINSPTLFAWAIDLCPEQTRGKGIATLFISLEAGIFTGSLATNYIYLNQISNLPAVFMTAAGFGCIALLYIIFYKKPNN